PWWVKNIDPSVIGAFVNFWRYREHQYLQDHYIAAWQKVALRFRDNPGVIAYDLMNEPHAGDLKKALGARLTGREAVLVPRTRQSDGRRFHVMTVPGFAAKAEAEAFCRIFTERRRRCVVRPDGGG
ncbi:MAG TPA: cellulase family glycosylhydrolase, partial [Azospirillaceae bacterium]|nr:cellulase family glycosylhydrolase [Azospirillaceae bacterium]